MSLIKQITFSLLIVLALGALGYWYSDRSAGGGRADAAGAQRPPPGVETIQATEQNLARRVEAVGTTRARQSIDVTPLDSGRVRSISFTPGSQVPEGSLLVQLDDTSERADVAEAEAERRNAELALDRARELQQRQNIAQSTVEELESAFAAAEARLERAQKQLAERRIEAPFAGQVGLKQVDVGARVDDQTIMTTLDDLSTVQVEFGVPEIFFGSVAEGQRVKATSVAFGERVFEGMIETVDSRIDAVSRSFKVRATIPNEDLTLPAGMFMLVELILTERMAVTVPEEAVTVTGDRASLYVVEDGKAMRRDIEIGQRELGLVEIVDGVEAGEPVIVSGIQSVRPGAPVRVVGDGADQDLPENGIPENGAPGHGDPENGGTEQADPPAAADAAAGSQADPASAEPRA